MIRKKLAYVAVILAILAIGVSTSLLLGIPQAYFGGSSANHAVINKVLSGVVASDPLNQTQTQEQLQSNQTYWLYGGDAQVVHAAYSFYQNAGALRIGVAASNNGNWTGFYAETPPTNASLVHAVLTATSESLPGYYDNGLYVQASNQLLNYVACLAVTTPKGTIWAVVHGSGNTVSAGTITPLWVDSSSNQKLSQDCTISTNGMNYLNVYLDNVPVYQNSSLRLGMPAPFNFYVESQTQYTSKVLYGSYQNFYATLGENVKITNIPAKAVNAMIVDSSGRVYATSPVVSGSASLAIGNYTFPLRAYIRVYSSSSVHSNATLVGSTPSAMTIYGGDVYSFGSIGSSTSKPTLTMNAVDASGNSLSGMFLTLSQNRKLLSTYYMPASFALNNSQTYTIVASDYGGYTFGHWSDGSTVRIKTFSISSNTVLTAYYRNNGSAAPPGMSVLNVKAIYSSGKPLTGMYTTLWQNGTLVSASDTPNSFLISNGASYEVILSNYGNYTFSHWSNGATDPIRTVNASDQNELDLVAVYNTVS
jgi:hypothetical protein